MPESLPTVVGLCSDKSHADEFYLPDPKPGETCPWCERKLIHYKRTTYRIEAQGLAATAGSLRASEDEYPLPVRGNW